MAQRLCNENGAPLVGKPRELQSILNLYLYHPLARRLAVALSSTPVSPNMVSAAGCALIIGAAVAYTGLDWPQSVLVGFALHALWHVVDGADGDLARLTGRASPIGELVDGACDYIGHGILYMALAAYLDDQIGWWAWLLGSAAAASRIAQSNHAESQRRIYLWRAYGVPWLQQAQSADDEMFRRKGLITRLSSSVAEGYLALARALNPSSAELDDKVERLRNDPLQHRRLRRLCRRAAQTPLILQILLGANPRTVMLGLSMALGSPYWFFVAECTVMNLLLLLSFGSQSRTNRRLVKHLQRG